MRSRSTRRNQKKVKVIGVGNIVERIGGVWIGITGRVIEKKPHNTPWATHIKVKVEYSNSIGRREREKIRVLTSEWSSVVSWKRIA